MNLKFFKLSFALQFIVVVVVSISTRAQSVQCEDYLKALKPSSSVENEEIPLLTRLISPLKNKAIKTILHTMAYFKGLPKYFKKIEQLRDSGDYLKYDNFGEMGLAEIGISVRYNLANFRNLNTGRPLIIIGNHHLGIADGLTLQHMASQARKDSPSILFLARWIEKLLPHAVYGDEQGWGTAIPVDINTPKLSDPMYDTKMAEINKFNSSWSRTSLKVLRNGGAAIIFPAGHVASINPGKQSYPENVYDAPNSWQEGFLNLARISKADIVFANVVSVNSQAFYEKRKRFGGGDLERVIWFFSEALAKKGQVIDVELSNPMTLEETYNALSKAYPSYTLEEIKANPSLTAELMRQYTYELSKHVPQTLDTLDSPARR